MRAIFTAGVAVLALAGAARGETPRERWVYCPVNMLVDANVEQVEAVFERAAKAGYTHVLLSDTKLHKLGDMDGRYLRNVERVKNAAKTRSLQIVPALFPIGYSESILWHDPNLAEALPVRNVTLEVKGGVARPKLFPTRLKGGDFSDLKQWAWHDAAVSYDAAEKALRIESPNGKNARIMQNVPLMHYRQFHLSFRVKTQNFRATLEAKVLPGSGPGIPQAAGLTFSNLGVKANQPWTTHHVVFNSLNNTDANVYIGAWGGGTGTCWVADAKLEESPFVNMVRRAGAPLVVLENGGAPLVEGKDFEPFVDPQMGNKPWKGSYDVWHEPPVLKLKKRLPEGTELNVAYYHVVTVHDGQVGICPSEKKTVDLLRDEARRIHGLFGAKGYFMSHDEIRVWNWCEACQKRQMDAGQLLAENARTCTKILRETAPGAHIYVWSDMFDPHHNARPNYYLSRGDFTNSWLGLEKDVTIALWHQGKAAESMAFFGERGHRMMIAGYYDGPVANAGKWLDAARTVGKGRVEGIMYTTWKRDYAQLEAFAREIGK